ncbi:hypothetical protein VP01_1309g1, partial [Puccinia sorghi]
CSISFGLSLVETLIYFISYFLNYFIFSNIPMSYLENQYFQEYQTELACSPYQLPEQVQVIEKVLPMVHAQNEGEIFEALKKKRQLTLSLDGWTNNSVIILLIMFIIYILPYMFLILLSRRLPVIQAWKKLSKEIRHFLNNVMWLASAKNTFLVGRNPTRSSTLFKPYVRTVGIPWQKALFIQVKEDQDHFTANKKLISSLQPAVNAISYLECSKAILANIGKQLIQTYKSIRNVDFYSQFESFKSHCVTVLHAQTKVSLNTSKLLPFFFTPISYSNKPSTQFPTAIRMIRVLA